MRFRFTTITATLSTLYIAFILATGIDVVDVASIIRQRIGTRYVDDLLLAALVVGGGVVLDFRGATTRAHTAAENRVQRANAEAEVQVQRPKAEAEVQSQRLQVLKATMRTVHDVVNNYLNGMQLVRL